MTKLTKSQQDALKWLSDRGGTGVWSKTGVLVAQGDWAHFMRSTWDALEKAGLILYYGKRVNIRV